MDNSAVAQNQNGVTTNVTPQGLILNSQAMNHACTHVTE